MSNFCPLVSPPLLYWCPGHLHMHRHRQKTHTHVHAHTTHTHSQAESQFIHITTFWYFYLLNLQAECWVVYSLLPFFPFWQWPVPFFKMRNNTIRHQSVFCTCLLVHITIHLGEAPLFGDMDLIAKGTIYNLIMTKNDVIEKPSEDFIFKLHVQMCKCAKTRTLFNNNVNTTIRKYSSRAFIFGHTFRFHWTVEDFLAFSHICLRQWKGKTYCCCKNMNRFKVSHHPILTSLF